jgi:hypothetical protein
VRFASPASETAVRPTGRLKHEAGLSRLAFGSGLATHASAGGGECFESFRGNRSAAIGAKAVFPVLQPLQGVVDVSDFRAKVPEDVDRRGAGLFQGTFLVQVSVAGAVQLSLALFVFGKQLAAALAQVLRDLLDTARVLRLRSGPLHVKVLSFPAYAHFAGPAWSRERRYPRRIAPAVADPEAGGYINSGLPARTPGGSAEFPMVKARRRDKAGWVVSGRTQANGGASARW